MTIVMDDGCLSRIGTSTLRSAESFLREETFQQPFLVAGLLVSVKGGRFRAEKTHIFGHEPFLNFLVLVLQMCLELGLSQILALDASERMID